MLCHILIPSVLEMREQLMKFRITETSHGKEKLRMLFDFKVGKHFSILLEEEKGSLHRVLDERIMLREREFHDFLIYRIIRDNVYWLACHIAPHRYSDTQNNAH